MKRYLAFLTAVCANAIFSPAAAQTAEDPSRFALDTGAIPQPVQIMRSQVEPNAALPVDRLTQSSVLDFAQFGRVSGYLMDLVQGNVDTRGAAHPVVTRYIVSRFADQAGAERATTSLDQAWGNAAHRSLAVHETLNWSAGNPRHFGSYVVSAHEALSSDITETFFQRSRDLVEIWQYSRHADSHPYRSDALRYREDMARELDAVAIASAGPSREKPAVALLAVRAEPALSHGGYVSASTVSAVTHGFPIQVVLYGWLQGSQRNVSVTAHFTFKRGRYSVGRADVTRRLDISAPRLYRFALPRTFATPGLVTIVGRVSVGGVNRTGTSDLTVR